MKFCKITAVPKLFESWVGLQFVVNYICIQISGSDQMLLEGLLFYSRPIVHNSGLREKLKNSPWICQNINTNVHVELCRPTAYKVQRKQISAAYNSGQHEKLSDLQMVN